MSWLELSENERREVLVETSNRIGLPPFVVEKDWWVVHSLRIVSQMEISKEMVFKGGTSLSKAWRIIDRFSEDIDLAINREYFGFSGNISRTQVGKLKDVSNKYLSGEFLYSLIHLFENGDFEVDIQIVDRKDADDDPVKIEIRYPTLVPYSDYIQPRVLLEIGSRSLIEPFTLCQFSSIIGETFVGRLFADAKMSFRCVNPERTLLEKLFLLHEEHQRPVEKMKIEGRSRHFFDICKLAQTEYASIALFNKELYHSIVEHRERFSKLGGVDYSLHYPPRLNPIPPESLITEWEKDYDNIQQNMLRNDDTPFDKALEATRLLVEQINASSILMK